MTTIDPVWATVAELSRAFGARTLSPVDAVEALIGRIRRRNPALHAYIAVYEADARLAAEAADKAIRAGHRVGPLHGVPIALKDLVDLEGRPLGTHRARSLARAVGVRDELPRCETLADPLRRADHRRLHGTGTGTLQKGARPAASPRLFSPRCGR